MQRQAVPSVGEDDAAILSELLSQGTPLSSEIVQAARSQPSVSVLSVLSAFGWPTPEDWPLSFYMCQDLHLGADIVKWYLQQDVKFEPSIYINAATRSDVATLRILRKHFGVSFAGSGVLAIAAANDRIESVNWLLEMSRFDIDLLILSMFLQTLAPYVSSWMIYAANTQRTYNLSYTSRANSLDSNEESPSQMPNKDPIHDERLVMNGTPLHFAVESGSINMVRLILTEGTDVDVNAFDQQRRTALDLAKIPNDDIYQEIAELLSEASEKIRPLLTK